MHGVVANLLETRQEEVTVYSGATFKSILRGLPGPSGGRSPKGLEKRIVTWVITNQMSWLRAGLEERRAGQRRSARRGGPPGEEPPPGKRQK